MSFEISVPGTDFKIKGGLVYTITPKYDADAPQGYQDWNTTKPLNPELTNTFNPKFNREMEVWDLGLHEHSPCLLGMPAEAKKAHLENVEKYIKKPVEDIKGENFLDHRSSNNKLNEFMITVGIGRFFNTNKPLDLFSLYCAILNKEVAPKELEKHPTFKKAQFCIENKEKEVNNKQRAELYKSKAIAEFHGLLEVDKKYLLEILDYIGIPSSANSTEETMNSFFTRWLNDKSSGTKNAEFFLEKAKRFNSEKGKDELYIYQQLEKLYTKGILKERKGEFFLDSEVIGTNLKTIAEQAATVETKLKEKIMQLSLGKEIE